MSSVVQQVKFLFSQHRGTGQLRKAWRGEHRGFGRMALLTFAWGRTKSSFIPADREASG